METPYFEFTGPVPEDLADLYGVVDPVQEQPVLAEQAPTGSQDGSQSRPDPNGPQFEVGGLGC